MQSGEYAAMFAAEDHLWWYAALRDAVGHTLRTLTPPGARLLDAGCGTGKNSEFLGALGYEVAASVDLSPLALSFCRRRGLSRLARASSARLPLAADSFDAACCLDVLGMLPDLDRSPTVAELYRVVRPGGIIVFHGAAFEFLRSQHDEVVQCYRRFRKEELRHLLLESAPDHRVEVVRLTYRMTALFPAIAAHKLVRKVARRPGCPADTDQQATPPWINGALRAVALAENRVLRRADLPFGSSLFAVVRKTG